MTNNKNTKKALLSSVIALILCFSMLIGTTFAWFTDSVTSANNTITAGNLDVELYHSDKTASEEKVTTETILFDDVELWEPGAVAYEILTVANEGTLALKYQLAVNISDANGVEYEGKLYTLADVLKVAVVDTSALESRESAIAAGEGKWNTLASFAQNGELYPAGTEGKNSKATYGIVIYWEPTDNDNIWNLSNGKTATDGSDILTITLGVNLFATQLMYEEDSFGPDYDADAILPWDGSIDTSWYDASATEYVLYTAEELAGLASLVNNSKVTFSGKTVKLGADINLGNLAWTPIGQTGATQFNGAFDGNGKTIYNLYIDNTANTSEYGAAGLFGWVEQHSGSNTISNLTIDGVNIVSYRYTGAIAGWINIPVTNCTVKNVTINCSYYDADTDGTKVGALVGYADNGSALTGNTVDTAILNAYGDVGGLAGVAQKNVSVDGNTVKNVIISYVSDKKSVPGELASDRVEFVVGTNTIENVTFIKSFAVSGAEELLAALSADEETIVINMAGDISVDIGTGKYYGGANTKSITINGNGNTLTLSSTYRSYFNLANEDAVLYLNNMTLTNAHTGTHFFDYTTNFNCDVVATKVNFAKAPLISNCVTAEFNNCQFNQPSTDGYGLWITSGATVTVNGGAVNSERGIKITDEDSPADKTTLTVSGTKFNNTEKAAILVTTKHGADVKLSNVDISNCAADTYYAVWVDEDRADSYGSVTVNGGKKVLESNWITDGLYTGTEANTYYVANANGMLAFAESVNKNGNTYSGKTVALIDEINLAGIDWEPIGQTGSTEFKGTFDGQNHTISNLTIDSSEETGKYYSTGLFGWTEDHGTGIVIKNVNVDGATVIGHHNVAVIVGYTYDADIINCHVTNARIVCSHANDDACGDKAGIIAGYSHSAITGCSATDSTVTAGRDAGQLVGAGYTNMVTDCTATNVNVTATNDCSEEANINNDLIGRKMG